MPPEQEIPINQGHNTEWGNKQDQDHTQPVIDIMLMQHPIHIRGKDHVISVEVLTIWETAPMPHQKKEKGSTDNMENKWDQEEITTETTGLEAVANKEEQPFKITPTEQEEMVKLIQLLGHQHHPEHKQMQHIQHLPIQQSELELPLHPHGRQPLL